ncbi:unnamed protein product [Brassicogethes aeneus]|uniref:C2 domain-containing protein n=1 Tax=Brassicogethes aeneus TaxID=1431903 RepID=A0A9P0FFU8_BRAAE|nr:unnamed protein product [Brassicogethes aeneus]
MLTYTSTSRIRRKIKTRLGDLKSKFQNDLTESIHQISSVDNDRLSVQLRKMMIKGSNTSLDSCGESDNISFTSTDTRESSSTSRTKLSSSCDSLLDDFDDRSFSGNSLLEEDPNILERLGHKIKNKSQTIHRYFQRNSRIQDVNKRLKSQIWSSVVTIVLVEGKNLLACDPETGTSDPYVKFRLGNEKYKSRIVWRSLNPRWIEQLDLHLYDDGDQQLEITVWDKDRSRDDFIGRTGINLAGLEREKTHSLWKELEDGAGSLHLLLTISGTTASETISDLTTYEENPREKEILESRYLWHRTFHNLKDVGHLTVKVFKATGLAAADLGGKSDPFVVLELGNARLQTQTEYKTLSPQWNKIFTFNVKDINNVLEVTVFDEDRDHKVEFLGKVAIPLLRIRNGERRWYALKDKKLRSRAKGNGPQILLELNVVWNPIRACIRTLNPKEEKYMQTEVKFKRQVFVKNVLRLKVFVLYFYEVGKVFQNCFEWESKIQSFAALLLWLVLCYYFEMWMLPVGGLLLFLKQYVVRALAGPTAVPWDEVADSDMDDEDDDDKEKEEKKSLKERLQAIQEVTQGVQNAIGKIASLLESVKNTFNFTVPYLSWIAISLLMIASVVLYLIPVRFLLMMWGTNKFLRRVLRPHAVPNNELLDLLSRIPDDEMLVSFRPIRTLEEKFAPMT